MSVKQRVAGWSVFLGELTFIGVCGWFMARYLS